ncbi:MAG: hypothetical protein AVDCRST_MAG67-3985 [uncultured Solirubrobacteraceae bacterium]|uniref:Uncharacterized protein n=1 Tax=uncultured Solirubrobacteraceae bacterium TaxID=1162706 RepID=A0A6J4TQC0_9ACTN|nr:MAG: hypothetical protein AVDCRST_MAG67-3985 [uncultured Solirubrobacteraceae bacterium]
MTTFATPDTERRRSELDARTRVAWTSYRDELSSLAGRAYDDAESAAWDQLQATLREVEIERAELALPAGH